MLVATWFVATAELQAQQPPAQNINIPMPTSGGQQLWTDHRWAAGWRMQQHAWTKHWRVLDSSNVRRAWGSREACLARLAEHQAQCQQPVAQSVVILLHGLTRSSDSMQPIARAFQTHGTWQTISFSYASTQDSIDHHAEALRELVDNLPGQPRIAIVGHSLGNIVVRRALSLWQDRDDQQVLRRLHRMVMLGPPNQGSSLAKKLSGLGLFEVIIGAPGQELGRAWDEFQVKLATPPCPFCIIAGELPPSPIWNNPLLEGESDFIVTVEETRLDGAAQSLTLPVLHTLLMSDSRVIDATLRFIDQP